VPPSGLQGCCGSRGRAFDSVVAFYSDVHAGIAPADVAASEQAGPSPLELSVGGILVGFEFPNVSQCQR
jgi:hypothetical protein